MSRPKKDSRVITIKMERHVFDSLEQFCADSGLTKTSAIERALTVYMANYYKEQKIIKDLQE